MNNTIELEITAPYAMFSDPTTRTGGERSSYLAPTYGALTGILKSIYWKPTFLWVPTDVRVMNPFRTEEKSVRTVSPCEMRKGKAVTDLSFYMYLKDVRYQVRAHFIWNKNRTEFAGDRDADKHYHIAQRMLGAGGRRAAFCGTSECGCNITPCVFGEGEGYYDGRGKLPLGMMFHGYTYPDEAVKEEEKGRLTARFWSPVMEDGVIRFIQPEECSITRDCGAMAMKQFPQKEAYAGRRQDNGMAGRPCTAVWPARTGSGNACK